VTLTPPTDFQGSGPPQPTWTTPWGNGSYNCGSNSVWQPFDGRSTVKGH